MKVLALLIVVCGIVATIALLKSGQVSIAAASGAASFSLAAGVPKIR